MHLHDRRKCGEILRLGGGIAQGVCVSDGSGILWPKPKARAKIKRTARPGAQSAAGNALKKDVRRRLVVLKMEPEGAFDGKFLGIWHIEVVASPREINAENLENIPYPYAVLPIRLSRRDVHQAAGIECTVGL